MASRHKVLPPSASEVAGDQRYSPVQVGHRARDTGEWCPTFLAALRGSGNVRLACEVAGVGKSTVYDRRDVDAVFAADWKLALDDATDSLEAEARRRALEGVDEPVFYRGEQVGAIRRYSDQLLITLLRALRPDQYRERVDLKMEVSQVIARLTNDPSEREAAFAEIDRILRGGAS